MSKEKRFEFGENWKKYSQTVTEEKIESAIKSLKDLYIPIE